MVSQVEVVPISFKITGLGPLPADWGIYPLGSLFEIKQGKSLSAKQNLGVNPKPFLRTANVLWGKLNLTTVDHMDFEENEFKHLCLKSDDLLVCEGGDIGRTAIWNSEIDECGYQNHLHRLRPSQKDVYPMFYMYWMQEAILQLGFYIGSGNKTTIPNLSQSRLKEFLLPKPEYKEQHAISLVLSTIQHAIEAQDKIISAAWELKKSLMRHLFTYGPVPLDEVDRVQLKETEIGLMPDPWKIVRLGDVVKEKITDGVHKTPSYVEFGVPFITAKDIVNNRIDFSNSRNIPSAEHQVLNKRVKPENGDILLTKVGTVGNVALVDTEAPFSIFVQIALIKPDNDKVDSNFLKYVLLTDNIQGDIVKNASQSTMKFIGTQKIAQVAIPLPELNEQCEIAFILSSIDAKIQAEENHKTTFQTLFNTMLHQLMTGQLRVKDLQIEN